VGAAAPYEAQGRALRRLTKAQTAFDRSQRKVAHLHVKLHQAEQKMVRRAARMEAAQAALTGESPVDAARALVGQDAVQEEGHGHGASTALLTEGGRSREGMTEGAEQAGAREPAAE
jgi:hypothetical protein